MEIGVDIIEVKRIKRVIEKYQRSINSNRFLNRVFTDKEVTFCESRRNKFQSYAVRFAAKEALLKAIGTGLSRGVKWKEIEIIDDDPVRGADRQHSKPKIEVYGRTKKLVRNRGIIVSLSHTKEYAVAFVVLA